jgi:hypothetical protein
MASNFSSVTVTWFDESDNYVTSADITSDVKAIPLFTDAGTGEVNQLSLVLIARDGNYITTGNIVEQYDRIRVECIDLDTNSYDRYFEILDIIPSQSKSEGTLLTIEGLGTEYHLQQIHYSGSHYFRHAFGIGEDIGKVYETNRGTRQPTLTAHDSVYSTVTKIGSDLPKFTNNHYDYGLFEDTCYNRYMDLIDKLGATVSAGGVLDFYELAFKTSGKDQIDLRLFSSGSTPTSPIIIKNTDSINVSESEAGISAATGNNIIAWGSPEHGSLPVGKSKYTSGEQFFLFRPQWRSLTGGYKQDAKVIHLGKHYESDNDNNTSTPPTNWTQIDMSTEFGDSVQYSPWTDDKTALWINSGSNADGAVKVVSPTHNWATSTAYTKYDIVIQSSKEYLALSDHTSGSFNTDLSAGKWEEVEFGYLGNDSAGMFDSNLCMWFKDNRISTWANRQVSNDTQITSLVSDYGYTGTGGITNLPVGTRILVNTGSGALSGTDSKTGKSFTNSITEVQEDEDGNHIWVVKYKMSADTDSFLVRVLDTHETLKYVNSTTSFTSITTDDLGNDTFHLYKSICNVDGVDDKPNITDGTTFPEVAGTDNTKFQTNIKSAIKINFNAGNTWVNRATDSANYLKTGCWINFTFPFPVNTHNGISEDIGALWGGTSTNQAPHFDFENMKFTHTGKRGFNETDSIDLGNISSIAFAMKMEIDVPALGVVDGLANMRCTLYDINDNVVVQDFELNYTDGKTWQNVVLPTGGFTDWRAVKPRYVALNNIVELLKPKETGAENLFEWRNVKMISIQLQNSYDEFGRYAPEGGDDLTNTTLQSNFGGNVSMTIDAFHFKKPLLVSSNDETAQTLRSLEPTFLQEPHIILYDQLLNSVKTQLEIDQFRHQEYDLTTSGTSVFDIDFGDSFFLEKDDFVFVPSADRVTGETANKIKLVAKRIEYHLTKPQVGRGGLTRTLRGVKRFT